MAQVRPADLVKALEISRPLASMMLSGKRGIPTWHLDAIARLLEVSVPDLFTPVSGKGLSDSADLAKKPYDVTSSDRGGGVTLPQPSKLIEPVARGERLDPSSSRTLSEREALKRLEEIYDATDAIRAAADAIRTGGRSGAQGRKKTQTKRAPRHSQLPRHPGGDQRRKA